MRFVNTIRAGFYRSKATELAESLDADRREKISTIIWKTRITKNKKMIYQDKLGTKEWPEL